MFEALNYWSFAANKSGFADQANTAFFDTCVRSHSSFCSLKDKRLKMSVGISFGIDEVRFCVDQNVGFIPSSVGGVAGCASHADSLACSLLCNRPAIVDVKRMLGYSTGEKQAAELSNVPQKLAVLFHSVQEALPGVHLTTWVVCLPYFDKNAYKLVEEAAKLANIDHLKVVAEYAACDLVYSRTTQAYAKEGPRIALHFNFETSVDLVLFEVEDGVYEKLCTMNVPGFSTKAIDDLLVKHVVQQAKKAGQTDLDAQALQATCRKAKHALSTSESVFINVDDHGCITTSLTSSPSGRSVCISRADFNDLLTDLMIQMRQSIILLLSTKLVQPSRVDNVVVAGKSSKVCGVRDMLERLFETSKVFMSIDPEEVTTLGAGLHASSLFRRVAGSCDDCYHGPLDVTQFALGIKSGDKTTMFIPKNTVLPAQKELWFRSHQARHEVVVVEEVQNDQEGTSTCHELWSFIFEGQKTQRLLQVEDIMLVRMTFELNAQNMLTVAAHESWSESETKVCFDLSKARAFNLHTDQKESDLELITKRVDTVPTSSSKQAIKQVAEYVD